MNFIKFYKVIWRNIFYLCRTAGNIMYKWSPLLLRALFLGAISHLLPTWEGNVQVTEFNLIS